MAGCAFGPVGDDIEGEEQPAQGVEPPDFGIISNFRKLSTRFAFGIRTCWLGKLTEWEYDTEDVEDDVCDGILR